MPKLSVRWRPKGWRNPHTEENVPVEWLKDELGMSVLKRRAEGYEEGASDMLAMLNEMGMISDDNLKNPSQD